MIAYLVRRLLGIIPTLLVMTLITFLVMHAVPGSPFDPAAFGGNDISLEAMANIEAKYGLDQPLPVQYRHFICSEVAHRHRLPMVFGAALQGPWAFFFAGGSRNLVALAPCWHIA